MSLYYHQVRNIKVSKVCLLRIFGIFPAGFDNQVAKAVLASCGIFMLMHYLRDLHYFIEEKQSYLQHVLTGAEIKIETMTAKSRSGATLLCCRLKCRNVCN